MTKVQKNNLLLAIFASLSLGLAPFIPEPHLFGKIRWVMGGAEGMGAMDWFDLVLHGAPWIFLLAVIAQILWSKRKKPEKQR
jgi:hypothetical protein